MTAKSQPQPSEAVTRAEFDRLLDALMDLSLRVEEHQHHRNAEDVMEGGLTYTATDEDMKAIAAVTDRLHALRHRLPEPKSNPPRPRAS